MGCGIYTIENKITGQMYIGSSIDVDVRWTVHRSQLRGGYHPNVYLQAAWNKYGEQNFGCELLEETEETDLDHKERKYIPDYETNEKGYNLSINSQRYGHYRNKKFKRLQSIGNSKYYGNYRYIEGTDLQGNVYYFDNLWDAAEHVKARGLSKGKHRNIRMKISSTARGVPVSNGSGFSVRKRAYQYLWKFIK